MTASGDNAANQDEGPGISRLTPTERRLLETLRSQPGVVMTRAELMAACMPDAVVLARTIDVHIKGLRRKLPVHDGRIEAVRGKGYRLVVGPYP